MSRVLDTRKLADESGLRIKYRRFDDGTTSLELPEETANALGIFYGSTYYKKRPIIYIDGHQGSFHYEKP